jgi:hypothetical protein
VNLGANQQILTINDLTASDALPNQVRLLDKLTIKWSITQAKSPRSIDLGTTQLPLFVTFAPAARGATGQAFVSLLYVGTKAAEGTGDGATVVGNIWTKVFKTRRELHRVEFNPVTGAMTTGPALSFWPPNWTPADLFTSYGKDAANGLVEFLRVHVGTCNALAPYMATMLGVQGIDAHVIAPDVNHGWPLLIHNNADFFLVGHWTPTSTTLSTPDLTADPDYPVVIQLDVPGDSDGSTIVATQFAYNNAPSQNNDTPRAMWETHTSIPVVGTAGGLSPGDHALVQLGQGMLDEILANKKIYDPSYGTGPTNDLRAWARSSIIGWGRLTDAAGNRINDDQCRAVGTCFVRIHVGSGL